MGIDFSVGDATPYEAAIPQRGIAATPSEIRTLRIEIQNSWRLSSSLEFPVSIFEFQDSGFRTFDANS
jgi:hypothetical protein